MNAFIRNYKKLTAVVGLAAALVIAIEAWSATASIRGRTAARFDLRRGHYRLLMYGLPPAARPEYVQLLKERYAIDTDVVGFCTIGATLRWYADGYDEVSVNAINRNFGHDVFKECWTEARRIYESKKAARTVNK
jgi:hypothetical protein